MLLKFRFKNYSCFKEWQEIDLLDFATSLDKICASPVSGIIGTNKSGKSSIIKLLQVSIDFLKHFLNYEKTVDFNPNRNQSISAKSNPFVFNNFSNIFKKTKEEIQEINNTVEEQKEILESNQGLDEDHNLSKKTIKINNEYESYNACIELFFLDSTTLYKYELSFNHLYSEYERLSISKNNGDQEIKWKYIYKKENLTYDVINQEETCVYSIDLDLDFLKVKKEPSFIHINKKNSLISYIKSISQSNALTNFLKLYSNVVFVDENNWQGIYKTYNIDKDYLKRNKSKFLLALNTLGFNVVDFSVNQININSFYLMIGKKNIHEKVMYINSEYESETLNKVIHILYYVFNALDNSQVLVMDNLNKSLNHDIVAYIIDLFNKQEGDIDNKAQFIFTMNSKYENDLIGICQSTNRVESDDIESKIKRVI